MQHLRNFAFVFVAAFLAARPSLAVSRWVPLGPFGGSVETLTVDPTDARVLYANLGAQGSFKSTDGGRHWTAVEPLGYNAVLAIAIDPVIPSRVFAGTRYDGVLRSIDRGDAGATWQELRRNLRAQTVYKLAGDPANPGRIYAATSNGVWVITAD